MWRGVLYPRRAECKPHALNTIWASVGTLSNLDGPIPICGCSNPSRWSSWIFVWMRYWCGSLLLPSFGFDDGPTSGNYIETSIFWRGTHSHRNWTFDQILQVLWAVHSFDKGARADRTDRLRRCCCCFLEVHVVLETEKASMVLVMARSTRRNSIQPCWCLFLLLPFLMFLFEFVFAFAVGKGGPFRSWRQDSSTTATTTAGTIWCLLAASILSSIAISIVILRSMHL